MGNQDRREFIKIAGTTLLVTSGISVFGLASALAKPKSGGDAFFSDGYYDDGYYDDGYYSDGYYDDGYYDDGYTTGFGQIRTDSIKMAIAPNPSKGNFELTLNSKTPERLSIHIHDLSGKTYLLKSCMIQQGTNRISFESNNLPVGVYEVSVVTSRGVAGNARLLIVE